MTTVGFIGSGRLAAAVAALSAAAGHRVVLSDPRGPQALADLIAGLGPLATASDRRAGRRGGRHRGRTDPAERLPEPPGRAAFLGSIGYDAVDAGALADSWRLEPGTPVYLSPYGSSSDETGAPASAEKIRAALAAARQ